MIFNGLLIGKNDITFMQNLNSIILREFTIWQKNFVHLSPSYSHTARDFCLQEISSIEENDSSSAATAFFSPLPPGIIPQLTPHSPNTAADPTKASFYYPNYLRPLYPPTTYFQI